MTASRFDLHVVFEMVTAVKNDDDYIYIILRTTILLAGILSFFSCHLKARTARRGGGGGAGSRSYSSLSGVVPDLVSRVGRVVPSKPAPSHPHCAHDP